MPLPRETERLDENPTCALALGIGRRWTPPWLGGAPPIRSSEVGRAERYVRIRIRAGRAAAESIAEQGIGAPDHNTRPSEHQSIKTKHQQQTSQAEQHACPPVQPLASCSPALPFGQILDPTAAADRPDGLRHGETGSHTLFTMAGLDDSDRDDQDA